MLAQMTLTRTSSLSSNASTLIEEEINVKRPMLSPAPSENGLEDLESQHELAKSVPTVGVLQRLTGAKRAVTAAAQKTVNMLVKPKTTIVRETQTAAPELFEVAGALEAGQATLVADQVVSPAAHVGRKVGAFVGGAGATLAWGGVLSTVGTNPSDAVVAGSLIAGPIAAAAGAVGGALAGGKLAGYISAKPGTLVHQ